MIALLLLLWVCAAGALMARRLDEGSRRPSETLALGAAVGLAVFAAFGFILGWTLGVSFSTVMGAAVLTMAIGLVAGARPAIRFGRPKKRAAWGAIVLSLLVAALVARLADRTLLETEAGIATGDRHNFGDLPFHMSIAAGFAYGNNFPPDHPELAGVALTYPFFCDLISGMVLAVGGSWRDAFFWPTLILGLSVVVALVRFGEAVTGSRVAGRVAAGLTFFSGGLGFLGPVDAQSLARWWESEPDFTINDQGVRYANFVTTLFIPQRSILFGWPLLFFGLAILVESLKRGRSTSDGPSRPQLWLRAGVLASLLPLVHAHSFAVIVFCVLFFAVMADTKAILAFGRGVVPLALPAILFMVTHNSLSTSGFFEWRPGFDGGADHPLEFWLINAGLFLPLVGLGVAWTSAASGQARMAAPFAALFVLANLFRLSPWIWDNMKFLAPAHGGLAPFAALALAAAWNHGRVGKAAALLAFATATLAGALDISKVAVSGREFGIFDRNDLAFADKVRRTTTAETAILTAPTHNHPVLLSGRRVFLGYEGHLWSQGLDYRDRKPIAEAMFRGELQATTGRAFIHVGAIAVTPAERALIPDRALDTLPSLIDSPYRLLRVR